MSQKEFYVRLANVPSVFAGVLSGILLAVTVIQLLARIEYPGGTVINPCYLYTRPLIGTLVWAFMAWFFGLWSSLHTTTKANNKNRKTMKKFAFVTILTTVFIYIKFVLAFINLSQFFIRPDKMVLVYFIGECAIWLFMAIFFTYYSVKQVKDIKKANAEHHHHHHHHHQHYE